MSTLIVWILFFLLKESWSTLSIVGIGPLFSGEGWFPTLGRFNLLPMIATSLVLGLGALIVAMTIGIFVAIFICYYTPPLLQKFTRGILDLMAGVPSVIFGLWALVTIVPLLAQWQGPGTTLLAGITVLAIMILPTVAILTEQALRRVPTDYHIAGLSLGLKRSTIIFSILLRIAKPSIISAGLLAFARAIGETMAVLMVSGNVVGYPDHFLKPVRALTANIALEMPYATSVHRGVLFVSGFLLILVVLSLVLFDQLGSRGQHDV